MGGADNLDEFIRKAHLVDYEGTRAMIEAHRVNVPRSTGVIQWMLNSAWPSLYWQLYDWYLIPTAGYWSVKKGCSPQQLIYNYANNHIYAVNDEKEDLSLTAKMKIYGLDGELLCNKACDVDMPTGCSIQLFELIPFDEDIHFVFLSLEDRKGNVVSRNEYVLSKVMDKHDWKKYRWWRTQVESYADFSALDTLTPAEVGAEIKKEGEEYHITLENKSDVVAFFIRMDIKSNEDLIHAWLTDNLVTLQPGETRSFSCQMDINEPELQLNISGWNVETKNIPFYSRK